MNKKYIILNNRMGVAPMKVKWLNNDDGIK